jgi:hypothetical protein
VAGWGALDPAPTFSVDASRIKQAVEAHTRERMLLQAHGDRAGAERILAERGTLRPEVQQVLKELEGSGVAGRRPVR